MMAYSTDHRRINGPGMLPSDDKGDSGQFIIGADVIDHMISEKHPLIMVDKIISYLSTPLSLTAERYISANEPVFIGHFPNMKLWPGIYTLEGLRQSCCLLQILHKLEEAGLMKGVIELQNRQLLRPRIDYKLCQNVIDYLKTIQKPDPNLFTIRVKLLAPVFAGSLIRYYVTKDDQDTHGWMVSATVDGRLIAKGMIILR